MDIFKRKTAKEPKQPIKRNEEHFHNQSRPEKVCDHPGGRERGAKACGIKRAMFP